MNYIISKFACVLYGDKVYSIYPYCKYGILKFDNTPYFVIDDSGVYPLDINSRVCSFEYNRDKYFILNGMNARCFTTIIKYKNTFVSVSLGERLHICSDGERLLDEFVYDISYSHFEIKKDYLIIYFKGRREYVVIIKNNELKIASYYDEININDGELIFMCKCYDCMQHGKVFLIDRNNEYDSYLVYLNQRQIQDEMFVGFAMLDSIIVGNTKYANTLLSNDMRLEDDKGLMDFFPEYDDYVCVDTDTYALLKKNTLAGIYKFEISNNQITNIIQMN